MSHLLQIAAYQPDLAPNLGSLIRLGVCFGLPVHVIEPCGFPFSHKSVRARALDYGEQVELTRHDTWDEFTAAKPGRVVLLTTKGADELYDFQFQPGDCLLLGRESAGVPEEVAAWADHRIKIPMPGGGRSLNVAIAAGIAIGEGLRQLR